MKKWFAQKIIWLAAKLGGVTTLIEWICEYLTSLLQKIKDKEEFAAYAEDVNQIGAYLEGCFARHQKWLTEAQREAANKTIAAIRNLASALKDCAITKEEIDRLIDDVLAAIEAWKKAK